MEYAHETYAIRGAAFHVHSKLGAGFTEAVYQEALEMEFVKRGIEYEREKLIRIYYNSKPLSTYFKADFVCYGKVIVELKALNDLLPENKAQVINYLKATGLEVALLINFGSSSLQIERVYRHNDGIYVTP